MSELAYPGGELALFEQAHNWKAYLRREIAPHLRGDVLEVGAGIGATTAVLSPAAPVRSWSCLEPDPSLAAQLAAAVSALGSAVRYQLHTGTLDDLPEAARFDTILYVDVLEHIERDAAELTAATERLASGGRLLVLSPAHDFLMSAFDRAIGHHRRYDLRTLLALAPPQLSRVTAKYLDSVGMLASLANRVLLRQALPTAAQIALWDQRLVPLSLRLDGVLGYRLGKSVLVVWQKA